MHLEEYSVDKSSERGWELLENGDLIQKTEEEGNDIIVTTDQNMRYQQNLAKRKLAAVVLMSTAWPRVRNFVPLIRKAIEDVKPGRVKEVPISRLDTKS